MPPSGSPAAPKMEIIADYKTHVEGEREVVSWDRPDGVTYYNVPVCYMRAVTADEYYENHPDMRGRLEPNRVHFWEVSVD